MIVLLHFPFDGIIGGIISALCRIGVPFFFLVSGFFAYKEGQTIDKQRANSKKKIIKYILLLVGITFVYYLKDMFKCIIGRITIGELFADFCTIEYIIANIGGDVGFLWFIRALLYIEVIQFFFGKYISKFAKSKISIIVIAIIWIVNILIFKYSKIIFGFSIPEPWSEILTKFICTAWFYYLIGSIIRSRETWLLGKLSPIKWWHYVCLLILIALNVIEYLIVNHYDVNQMPVDYIFTLPCALFIFMILFVHREWGKGRLITFIGKNISMYIYYWHGFVGVTIIGYFATLLGIPEVIYSNAFFVYFVTLLVGIAIYYGKKFCISKFRREKNRRE